MDDPYQMLAEILEEEALVAERLISLGSEETEALKQNDVNSLKRLLEEQQEPAGLMERLEQRRQGVQRELGQRLQLTGLTFKRLLDFAGSAAPRLKQAGTLLAARLEKLQEISETNRLLILQALSFHEQMRKALSGVLESYNGRGQKVNTPGVPAATLNRSV